MRFVLDTNVIVSALLIADSGPRHAFEKALAEGSILISITVLLELAEVLGRKRLNKYLTEAERMQFLVAFLKEAELVDISEKITECRDPKDNKFLELATSGNAVCIITGDDDLLELDAFRGISIVNPSEFLKIDWSKG